MTLKHEYDRKVPRRDVHRRNHDERKNRSWSRMEREMRDDRMNQAQEDGMGDDEDTKEYKRSELAW